MSAPRTTRSVPPERYRFLPESARRRLEQLPEHTGAEPQVTRLDNGYRITAVSPRVVLVMDWRRRPWAGSCRPRKASWSYHSTLTVDGAPVPLVKNMKELAALWADPDTAGQPRSFDTTGLKDAHIPELGEAPGPAPVMIEMLFRKNRAGVREHGGTAQLGYRDGEWQILICVTDEAGQRLEVYLSFAPDTHGRYGAEGLRLVIAVDGKDCTHLADEIDLAALGLTWPSPTPGSALPAGKPQRESGAATTNSVLVRRATVIRT